MTFLKKERQWNLLLFCSSSSRKNFSFYPGKFRDTQFFGKFNTLSLNTLLVYIILCLHIIVFFWGTRIPPKNNFILVDYSSWIQKNDHNSKNKNLKFDFPIDSADSGSFMQLWTIMFKVAWKNLNFHATLTINKSFFFFYFFEYWNIFHFIF